VREGDFAGLKAPLVLHGAKAVTGSALVQIIYLNNRIFKAVDFYPYLPGIRAQLEDSLLVIGNTRAEDQVGSRNTIRLDGPAPAQVIMSALYDLTPRGSYKAIYESNCLILNFDTISREDHRDCSEVQLDKIRNH
jgi:hypothetical protein